jgi:adenylyl- and sulfurtransferase ThiI
MVLWWIANVVALVVVVPLVVVLAQRVIRLVREIERYATDIRTHADGLAGALEPLPALATTRERVGIAKRHAVGYASALERALV